MNPLGIDAAEPRLSWRIASSRRGTMQQAYQVLVAGSEASLGAERGDLWDSGRIESDRSLQIAYGGTPLTSGQRALWKVRVWDDAGNVSPYSAPAFWERGLEGAQDWRARWIALSPRPDPAPPELSLAGVPWIGAPEPEPARGAVVRLFRTHLELPPDRRLRRARLLLAAHSGFFFRLNGDWIGAGSDVALLDLTEDLVPGTNELGFTLNNTAGGTALAARCVVEFDTGEPLVIATGARWETAPHDEAGRASGAFAPASWAPARELGRFGEGLWEGKYLNVANALRRGLPGPSPLLRKAFDVTRPVRKARVYATALGVYELRLNGEKVGADVLSPGWTDYNKRVQYQTYDVTTRLRPGPNAMGVVLGDGWYSGYVGWGNQRAHYGAVPKARVELRVTYEDGTTQAVATDSSWRSALGPILSSDLLKGETFDARRDPPGWDTPYFSDAAWTAVAEEAAPAIAVVAQEGPPVQRTQELVARSVTEPARGRFVFDLGQNIVGWARLKVRGPAGTRVRLRFAEVLQPDGGLYTVNLRGARSTDIYVLRGGNEEVFEPHFTFHGFRYVEVSGYPGRPAPDAITGIVVHSVMPPTGSFETSSALVNQLQRNIQWGQRGNFLSIPTDCPQRDERLGWMGDAQIFARTACFNRDVAGFFAKWMVDVEDAQSAEGGFPDVAPRLVNNEDGAPAWGDAGVLVPWTMYQCYGDLGLVARHYDAMKKWVRYVDAANPDHLWRRRVNNNYGDWVAVGTPAPKDVLATAYFARSAKLVAQMGRALGKTEEARHHEELFEGIRGAFNREYVTPEGRIKGDDQTVYALALRFGLLSDLGRAAAARHLAEDLARNDGRLTTGFLGVGHLLPALSETGQDALAYRLLMNETFPSWGYSIKEGATSIWERWDGRTEKGFQNPGMNSFNHYSFGSVGEWMYSVIGGLDLDPAEPGYKHVIVRPRPGGGLTYARTTYESVHGAVATEWTIEGRRLTLNVTVPANTRATVHVPGVGHGATVSESGAKAESSPGVHFLRREGGTAVYEVGSGRYEFVVDGFASNTP